MARIELYIYAHITDETDISDVEEMYRVISNWKQNYCLEEKCWEVYLVRPAQIDFTPQKRIFIEKKIHGKGY